MANPICRVDDEGLSLSDVMGIPALVVGSVFVMPEEVEKLEEVPRPSNVTVIDLAWPVGIAISVGGRSVGDCTTVSIGSGVIDGAGVAEGVGVGVSEDVSADIDDSTKADVGSSVATSASDSLWHVSSGL